MNQASLLL